MFNLFYDFAQWLVNGVFGLASETHLSHSLVFFIYDFLKILTLIIIITHLMSLLRYYLPIEKIRDFLTKKKLYGLEYLFATIFGAVTPFCSCSSIPLFIGFLEAGIPLGVTFSFIITSPLINQVSIAIFIAIFGWKLTLTYVTAGILVGIVGGLIIEKLNMQKYVEEFVWKLKSKNELNKTNEKLKLKEIFKIISREAMQVTKKILPYLLIGIGLGAFIHGFVPEGFFEIYLEKAGIFGVPIATILSVPLYADATSIIPVMQALVEKGVPIGTAMAFMMGTIGLSLPAALILKRVLKWQLLGVFFGIVTIGIIIIGYTINILF